MEVNCADKVYNRVKCSGRFGRAVKKRRGIVARLENASETQVVPRAGEIMERNLPFFMFGVGMMLVYETTDAVFLTKIAFVVLAIMLVGNFLFHLEEAWQKSVGILKNGSGSVGNMLRHVTHED